MSRKFLLNTEKDANTLISGREVQELHQQWDVAYASDVTAWTLVNAYSEPDASQASCLKSKSSVPRASRGATGCQGFCPTKVQKGWVAATLGDTRGPTMRDRTWCLQSRVVTRGPANRCRTHKNRKQADRRHSTRAQQWKGPIGGFGRVTVFSRLSGSVF